LVLWLNLALLVNLKIVFYGIKYKILKENLKNGKKMKN